MTRGRRLLLALLQITAGVNVAGRCRVPKQHVSEWSAGTRVPSARARALLEANYGLPCRAWSEPWRAPR